MKNAQIAEFLRTRGRQIRRALHIVWDGAGARKNRQVCEWFNAQADRIIVAFCRRTLRNSNLLAAIWSYLKMHEIAHPAHRTWPMSATSACRMLKPD